MAEKITSPNLPIHIKNFMYLQNVYHIANLYFEYEENPKYYQMRPIAHFLPIITQNKISFKLEKTKIGLIDEHEIEDMISNINYQQFSENLKSFIDYLDEKSSDINNRSIMIIKSRLKRIDSICQSICTTPDDFSHKADKNKLEKNVLWQLNGLFKNEENESFQYARALISVMMDP